MGVLLMCCRAVTGALPYIHRMESEMLPWQVLRFLSRPGGGWMPSLLAQALEAPSQVLPGITLHPYLFASFAHGSG